MSKANKSVLNIIAHLPNNQTKNQGKLQIPGAMLHIKTIIAC